MTYHHDWHKRWNVDLPTFSATHETGLLVRFFPVVNNIADVGDPDVVLGNFINQKGNVYTAKDGSKWIVVTTSEYCDATLKFLAVKNGLGNAPIMLDRLAREAGMAWVWQLDKKNYDDAKKPKPSN